MRSISFLCQTTSRVVSGGQPHGLLCSRTAFLCSFPAYPLLLRLSPDALSVLHNRFPGGSMAMGDTLAQPCIWHTCAVPAFASIERGRKGSESGKGGVGSLVLFGCRNTGSLCSSVVPDCFSVTQQWFHSSRIQDHHESDLARGCGVQQPPDVSPGASKAAPPDQFPPASPMAFTWRRASKKTGPPWRSRTRVGRSVPIWVTCGCSAYFIA